MNSILPAAGVHPAVPFNLYGEWPAANFSLLKHFERSALHAKYAMDNPREATASLRMGHALHVATFEPARFADEFRVIPEFDRRTTAGKEGFLRAIEGICGREIPDGVKARKEELIAHVEQSGKSILDETELSELRGMGDAIRNCRAAARLIAAAGECEVSCLWRDEATGLDCKARFDKRIAAMRSGRPAIVELKSTRNAKAFPFARDCANYFYHGQAAHYRRGHQACTGVLPLHFIIAVESAPPHGVAVYVLSDIDLQTGDLLTRRWLNQYAECQRTSNWPGYPDKAEELRLPIWAQEVEAEEAV